MPDIHKAQILGTVRADHAMVPKSVGEDGKKSVHYFEVKIEKQGKIVDQQKGYP